jgi:hypothetical protein
LGFSWEKLAVTFANNRNANSMDLAQRHIIKSLRIKGLRLGEIAKEFSSAYGVDAYTPPSAKYWLHQIKRGRTDLRTPHAHGRPPVDDIDAEILSLLRKYPFSSVRAIADSLEIPASIIYLVEKIGLKIFLLRWVPHALTSELRQKSVELSSQLLQVLESRQRVGFRDIVAGDPGLGCTHLARLPEESSDIASVSNSLFG